MKPHNRLPVRLVMALGVTFGMTTLLLPLFAQEHTLNLPNDLEVMYIERNPKYPRYIAIYQDPTIFTDDWVPYRISVPKGRRLFGLACGCDRQLPRNAQNDHHHPTNVKIAPRAERRDCRCLEKLSVRWP
jgi:hypothetical protein